MKERERDKREGETETERGGGRNGERESEVAVEERERTDRKWNSEAESERVLHVCRFPALSGPCQPVIYGTETGSSLRCQLSIVTTDS